MKLKSLFTLALTLAIVGLSLPAVAGSKNGDNSHNSHDSRPKYHGKYHYYELSSGDYIYIGSHGDYWDSTKHYHEASDNPSYASYYNSRYSWKKGDYYYKGEYYPKR